MVGTYAPRVGLRLLPMGAGHSRPAAIGTKYQCHAIPEYRGAFNEEAEAALVTGDDLTARDPERVLHRVVRVRHEQLLSLARRLERLRCPFSMVCWQIEDELAKATSERLTKAAYAPLPGRRFSCLESADADDSNSNTSPRGERTLHAPLTLSLSHTPHNEVLT